LFPVQPTTVARYRSAFTPSRAKDDPTDAEVVLELLLRHRDKLKPLQPERAEMRTLRRVVEGRRDLVHDRTRLTNRITNALKAYFPQVLDWFRDKDSTVFADFLERWPTLEAAQRARKDTLEAFFRTSNVRRTATIKRRIDAIREESPLHSDDAVTIPARMLVDALLPQLRALSASIARFDDEIARLAPQLPDYELFAALPGAGPTLAPRLLAAFGERRERFPDAAALQKCAGIAPVIERSGNKSWVHWTYSCSKFLRQAFVEWGSSNHPALLLGKSLLRVPPRSGRPTSGRPASPRLQVDSNPPPLLARSRALRRVAIPHGTPETISSATQTRGSEQQLTFLCGPPQGVSWTASRQSGSTRPSASSVASSYSASSVSVRARIRPSSAVLGMARI
jgi:transposase